MKSFEFNVSYSPQHVFDYVNHLHLHRRGREKKKYDEIYSHDHFELKEIEIGDPSVKWSYGNHPPVVSSYEKLNTKYPPIVVNSNGYILDGTHRAGAARKRGDKTIMALVGTKKNKIKEGIVMKLSPEVEGIYNSIMQESRILMEREGSFSYDCAYIRFPQDVTDVVQEWIRINIPKQWVYEEQGDDSFGVERESHCTILYGFDPAECNATQVQNKMIENSFHPIRFSLGEIGIFSNEKYAVLKVEVQGKDLHHIHGFLKSAFKNCDSYPVYNPHATLCYIKKEHEADIKQFVGDRIFRICEMTAKSFIYSNQGRIKEEIKLVADQIEGAKDAGEKVSV
jgi:2'-5' RNA ligase